MGFPNNTLSDVAFLYPWLGLAQDDPTQYTDSCMGGTGIQNPVGGSMFQLWSFDTDGASVYATAGTTGRVKIYTPDTPIESMRVCFDQNMYPFICYLYGGTWNYYWYDTQEGAPVLSQLPAATNSVACTLDDKRAMNASTSDICLLYTLNNNLYYLRQRDRYETAYLLKSDVDATLVKVAMNSVNRLQIKMQATTV